MDIPRGSKVVPFLGVPVFLVRDSNILPQKELLWSPWVWRFYSIEALILRIRCWVHPGISYYTNSYVRNPEE